MNTVLLLFILSFVLDIRANQVVDRLKASGGYGWGSVLAVTVTCLLSAVAFAAGVVKWCLL